MTGVETDEIKSNNPIMYQLRTPTTSILISLDEQRNNLFLQLDVDQGDSSELARSLSERYKKRFIKADGYERVISKKEGSSGPVSIAVCPEKKGYFLTLNTSGKDLTSSLGKIKEVFDSVSKLVPEVSKGLEKKMKDLTLSYLKNADGKIDIPSGEVMRLTSEGRPDEYLFRNGSYNNQPSVLESLVSLVYRNKEHEPPLPYPFAEGISRNILTDLEWEVSIYCYRALVAWGNIEETDTPRSKIRGLNKSFYDFERARRICEFIVEHESKKDLNIDSLLAVRASLSKTIFNQSMLLGIKADINRKYDIALRANERAQKLTGTLYDQAKKIYETETDEPFDEEPTYYDVLQDNHKTLLHAAQNLRQCKQFALAQGITLPNQFFSVTELRPEERLLHHLAEEDYESARKVYDRIRERNLTDPLNLRTPMDFKVP